MTTNTVRIWITGLQQWNHSVALFQLIQGIWKADSLVCYSEHQLKSIHFLSVIQITIQKIAWSITGQILSYVLFDLHVFAKMYFFYHVSYNFFPHSMSMSELSRFHLQFQKGFQFCIFYTSCNHYIFYVTFVQSF